MLGPVMINMQRPDSRRRSLGTNGAVENRCTMGWRPYSMLRRHAARLQGAEAIDELGQEGLVDLFLTGERAVACAQHLVFEPFELFRDEALGRLDGLAADVILWHTLRILACDFNEEAGHAVVAEFQSGDAGSFALAALELE